MDKYIQGFKTGVLIGIEVATIEFKACIIIVIYFNYKLYIII